MLRPGGELGIHCDQAAAVLIAHRKNGERSARDVRLGGKRGHARHNQPRRRGLRAIPRRACLRGVWALSLHLAHTAGVAELAAGMDDVVLRAITSPKAFDAGRRGRRARPCARECGAQTNTHSASTTGTLRAASPARALRRAAPVRPESARAHRTVFAGGWVRQPHLRSRLCCSFPWQALAAVGARPPPHPPTLPQAGPPHCLP